MALAELNWFSQTLEKMVATSVILPDVGKPPFATYYLLHGLSDDHTAWRRRSRIEHRRIFGQKPKGSDHDLLALAKRAKRRQKLPAIQIDCGTDDKLIDVNRAFHDELEKLGVPHDYAEHPGDHTWDYWNQHIQ